MAITAQMFLNEPVPYVQVVADWSPNSVLWRNPVGQPQAQVAYVAIPGAAANPTTGAASTVTVWRDYEIPQGVPTTYQVGKGALSNTVTMPDMGPWMIDRTDPSLSVPFMGPPSMFSGWTRSKVVTSTAVLGSDTPFNVSMTRQRPAGQIVLQDLTQDAHVALIACLNSPGPKLLSFPPSWWAAVDVSWVDISDVADIVASTYLGNVMWQTTLTLIPAGVPPVVVPVVAGGSWDTEPASWSDMPANWANC